MGTVFCTAGWYRGGEGGEEKGHGYDVQVGVNSQAIGHLSPS